MSGHLFYLRKDWLNRFSDYIAPVVYIKTVDKQRLKSYGDGSAYKSVANKLSISFAKLWDVILNKSYAEFNNVSPFYSGYKVTTEQGLILSQLGYTDDEAIRHIIKNYSIGCGNIKVYYLYNTEAFAIDESIISTFFVTYEYVTNPATEVEEPLITIYLSKNFNPADHFDCYSILVELYNTALVAYEFNDYANKLTDIDCEQIIVLQASPSQAQLIFCYLVNLFGFVNTFLDIKSIDDFIKYSDFYCVGLSADLLDRIWEYSKTKSPIEFELINEVYQVMMDRDYNDSVSDFNAN